MRRLQLLGQVLTYVISTAIKLAGLFIAVDQLLLHSSTKPVYLALAAFMMAGAQLTEQGVLAFLEHLGFKHEKPEFGAAKEKEQ